MRRVLGEECAHTHHGRKRVCRRVEVDHSEPHTGVPVAPPVVRHAVDPLAVVERSRDRRRVIEVVHHISGERAPAELRWDRERAVGLFIHASGVAHDAVDQRDGRVVHPGRQGVHVVRVQLRTSAVVVVVVVVGVVGGWLQGWRAGKGVKTGRDMGGEGCQASRYGSTTARA